MNIKKLAYTMMAAVALFATGSCSDPDAEVTSIELARALRPTDVTVKVQDKVNAKITSYYVYTPDVITYEFYNLNSNSTEPEVVYNQEIPAEKKGTTHYNASHTQKLDSETPYKLVLTSVRDGKKSEAIEVEFQTDAEQILNDVPDSDITSSTVKLTWAPGEKVTKITVNKKVDGEEKVLQTINLTADQIAAGQCLVQDLVKESTYTFYIFNGDKQRGKMVVKTMADYIAVKAGVNVDLQGIIDAAEAGKTIMLLPADDGSNEFIFQSEEGAATIKDITITKDITISGMASQPVIVNVAYKLSPNANFTTENLTYKCAGKVLVSTSEAGAYGDVTFNSVKVDGCNQLVQINGENIMTMNSISVKNCFIKNVAQAIIRNDKGGVINNIVFEQNTVAGGATTRGFYIGNKSVKCLNTATIKNNTFCKLTGLTYGLVYIRSVTGGTDYSAVVEKNFMVDCETSVISKDGQTNGNDYKQNYYLNCAGFLDSSKKAYDANGKVVEGNAFQDAANDNYTIVQSAVADAEAGNTEFAKVWGK